MKKAIILSIIGLIIVVGVLAGIKALQIRAMMAQGAKFVMPPEIVTSAPVQSDTWESTLSAVGTLEAVQGVVVTAEMTGKVEHIAFEAGKRVAAGDLLVQQDVSVEKAQLKAAEAMAELARINFERSKTLLPEHSISQSDYDNALAKLTEAQSQIDNIQALIAKKTIRAPFAGRLGIRQINLGQVINDGQAIVSLQSLGPIFVNFLLPQQQLAKLRNGLKVRLRSDALPGQTLNGEITAIDPKVDAATRNIRVQALVPNPKEQLRGGMFVNLTLVLPQAEQVLTIPATAVLYAPYSDSVFVIEEKKNAAGKPAGKAVRQQFVTLGEKRGDFISVKSGLKAGESIVSTGAFKLRNGQGVIVDNKLAPEFKLAPQPAEG
ncbi:efflux RND transporter periplasmic adaptor subunit [Geopsychrobacter electrodiphilus]|uniref:efflux RND transporter periplasmic adaptor subunit n=1 Tax=Geopsychrobacter electrodiphilus TaxID=225196 RepID=UPI0003796B52|nr:efflux RND transporter periplasmic adaptor subunit [Geopsychrobacter electrodiphilus]